MILRWNSPEWFDSSMKSDLDMPFAIWSLDVAIHNLFLLFMIWENEIFTLDQREQQLNNSSISDFHFKEPL